LPGLTRAPARRARHTYPGTAFPGLWALLGRGALPIGSAPIVALTIPWMRGPVEPQRTCARGEPERAQRHTVRPCRIAPRASGVAQERQAPCPAHQRGWSEATSQVLPHGLEPGTHVVTEFGNDQAVLKVIPAGQAGKRDRGTHGLEPRDRLRRVLNGHPP